MSENDRTSTNSSRDGPSLPRVPSDGTGTSRASPASSAETGIDDPICISGAASVGHFETVVCMQCRELRLKNKELRRVSKQKSDLHHEGVLLMASMQKGHNEAIGVLRARIHSLEAQLALVQSQEGPCETTIRELQEELTLKTSENLELATAFEELEGEEREVVSALRQQLEHHARQLFESRAEAQRTAQALESAKQDIYQLANWIIECEGELVGSLLLSRSVRPGSRPRGAKRVIHSLLHSSKSVSL